MFTGLVEEVGNVVKVKRSGASSRLTIAANLVLQDMKIDDSICVDGVCLTAVVIADNSFEIEAVDETLRKTNLGSLNIGKRVNLERCLRPSDRFGGHIVQGHVDSSATITARQSQDSGRLLTIKIPPQISKYVISEGSVAINGVSLTVARKEENQIVIALIPHTLGKTNLGNLNIGDSVNIEVDLIGKYVESLLTAPSANKLTETWIKQLGYE